MTDLHTPLYIRQDMKDPEYRALYERILTPLDDLCQQCGEPILAPRFRGYRRKYCSAECREDAKRARDRAYRRQMRSYLR